MKTKTISFNEIVKNNNILSANYYLDELTKLKEYFGEETYFCNMPHSVIKKILFLIDSEKKLKELKKII